MREKNLEEFNTASAYLEIFLSKVVSKIDLYHLLKKSGINFDEEFNLEKSDQFDLVVILMNDVEPEILLKEVDELRAKKYQEIKDLQTATVLVGDLKNKTDKELAEHFLAVSKNKKLKGFVGDFLKSADNVQISRKDLLYFILEDELCRDK